MKILIILLMVIVGGGIDYLLGFSLPLWKQVIIKVYYGLNGIIIYYLTKNR